MLLYRIFFVLIFTKIICYNFANEIDNHERSRNIEKKSIRGPEESGLGITLRRYGNIVFVVLAPTEKPELVAKPAEVSVKSNKIQVKSTIQNVQIESPKFEAETVSKSTIQLEEFQQRPKTAPEVQKPPPFKPSRVHGEIKTQATPLRPFVTTQRPAVSKSTIQLEEFQQRPKTAPKVQKPPPFKPSRVHGEIKTQATTLRPFVTAQRPAEFRPRTTTLRSFSTIPTTHRPPIPPPRQPAHPWRNVTTQRPAEFRPQTTTLRSFATIPTTHRPPIPPPRQPAHPWRNVTAQRPAEFRIQTTTLRSFATKPSRVQGEVKTQATTLRPFVTTQRPAEFRSQTTTLRSFATKPSQVHGEVKTQATTLRPFVTTQRPAEFRSQTTTLRSFATIPTTHRPPIPPPRQPAHPWENLTTPRPAEFHSQTTTLRSFATKPSRVHGEVKTQATTLRPFVTTQRSTEFRPQTTTLRSFATIPTTRKPPIPLPRKPAPPWRNPFAPSRQTQPRITAPSWFGTSKEPQFTQAVSPVTTAPPRPIEVPRRTLQPTRLRPVTGRIQTLAPSFTTPVPSRPSISTASPVWHPSRPEGFTAKRPQQPQVTTARTPTLAEKTKKSQKPRIAAHKEKQIPLVRPIYKPPIIHRAPPPYRGPTYNCRILDPVNDGRPSSRTDPTCSLIYPGFSADGSCRCTYEVEDRDANGCATGFLYTCSRVSG